MLVFLLQTLSNKLKLKYILWRTIRRRSVRFIRIKRLNFGSKSNLFNSNYNFTYSFNTSYYELIVVQNKIVNWAFIAPTTKTFTIVNVRSNFKIYYKNEIFYLL